MALSPSCAQRLNGYCDANCPLAQTHGPLVAAFSGSERSDEAAWRCYAHSALEHGVYSSGTLYCTRHAALAMLLKECQSEVPPSIAVEPLRAQVSPLGQTAETALLEPWPDGQEELTLAAVDTRSWQPTPEAELVRVHAWRVPCIDSLDEHALRNRTKNVSRKKAFLSRAGLKCFGMCMRGVVDGFATVEEMEQMLSIMPIPTLTQPTAIKSWRWGERRVRSASKGHRTIGAACFCEP